jgi:hypothetical protein
MLEPHLQSIFLMILTGSQEVGRIVICTNYTDLHNTISKSQNWHQHHTVSYSTALTGISPVFMCGHLWVGYK